MDLEKGKFQYASLKFLYELELIDDPQLINNLKLNVFQVSGCIREVEFLASYHHRSLLIFIDVSWFGRKFMLQRIELGVMERVKQLLPNFKFRVTADRKIFDLALEKVRAVLKGERNEDPSTISANVSGSDERVQRTSPASSETELPTESSLYGNGQTKARS